MGTTNTNAATTTMMEAIDDVHPDYIISCGIAFGRDSTKQKLGDVLVSEWVRMYGPQRVGSIEIIPRGDRVPADGKLLQLVSLTSHQCSGFTCWPGGLLSGDDLVDNPELKAKLLLVEPEAIGGDMEAAGVVSAAGKKHVPWIITKGICDWGENKDSKDQRLAATNAFSLLRAMLQMKVLSKRL